MSSRLIVDRHVPIPMRDGTQLHADIFRPDTEEKVPVIVSRTPYEKGGTRNAENMLNPLRAAEAGYAVVFQDARGRWRAEGDFYPFVNEANDGYDTVEWLAAQPWSSGAVGMAGSSYVGATQWLAALSQPPHLKAIAPRVTTSNYYEGWTYQGGAFQLGFALSWAMSALSPDMARRTVGSDVSLRLATNHDQSDPHFDYLPLKTQPLLRESESADYYFDWLDHPTYDDFWKSLAVREQYA